MDRRAAIFIVFAVVCAVLVPLTDDKYRWVPIVTAITYVVLALASFLDALSRRRSS